jgi:hypothetical protein
MFSSTAGILLAAVLAATSKFRRGAYPEVPDGLVLRSGLMACWSPVEQVIRQTLDITIPPDPRLKEPDRYRRTPWGIRIATDHRDDPTKNILGVPAGARIPQIVIYSRGRAYSKSGDEWLLPPRTFFEEVRRPRPSRSRRPSTTTEALDPATREDLIAAINRLCENLFGPPERAPFAVDVDRSRMSGGSNSAMTCEIASPVHF